MKTGKYIKLFLIIFILLLTLPIYADIIITKSEGNIEDVSVIEITDTEIIYKQKNIQKSIPCEKVEAILYDDGRYVTVSCKSQIQTTDDGNVTEEMESNPISNNNKLYKERKNRTKNDERPSNYEVKQAFKEAAKTTKEAFSKMFNSWKKAFDSLKKDKETKENDNSSTPQSENENNW